jgi:hypoxanthine phosphoribosyltransferase
VKSGVELAQSATKGYRVVSYDELRTKASLVAGSLLERYRGHSGGIVISPILMGGGLPARLILDTLAPFGIVRAVVPCQVSRYTGVAQAGAAKILTSLPRSRVGGVVVVGVDDLVDGGETLRAFCAHASAQGAAIVDTAVLFEKPRSTFVPGHSAEKGVTQWLVLPGEEHDFMHELTHMDKSVGGLSRSGQHAYFVRLGLSAHVVSEWLALQ